MTYDVATWAVIAATVWAVVVSIVMCVEFHRRSWPDAEEAERAEFARLKAKYEP